MALEYCSNLDVLKTMSVIKLVAVLIAAGICVGIWFKFRRQSTFSFIFSVVVLLAAGTALLSVQIPYVGSEFPRALGHAFIIAAILGATVDHYLKERVLRDVSRDVSKYLVGYRLPEEVQNRIRELMQTKWIRRKFEIRCAFVEVDQGNKIKVEIRVSEEIENITSEPLEYQDRIEYAKHDPFALIELQCDSEDEACKYYYGPNEVKRLMTEHEGSLIFTAKRVIIPPMSLAGGRAYRFRARYELVHPPNFQESIDLLQPTIGVSVEITDAPEGYSFHVDPEVAPIGHNRWEYKRLFLPGEHVTIKWERPAGEKSLSAAQPAK